MQAHLFVGLECDRPGSGGARYALASIDEVLVGRGADRGAARQVSGGVTRLKVTVPGRSMSSTHARFLRTSEGWVLEDARSTNGSFVNGQRVDRVRLRDLDLIELGHTVFSLREAVPTPPGTPPIFDTQQTPAPDPDLTTLLPALGKDFETLVRFAGSPIPLLILGETGTGKEVVARAMHRLSRRGGPFVAVNCGALPANLVESQLFGHVRGAFSGANRDEPGFVRAAEHGTLLLDEIGDLPAVAQATLLRVLQEHEVVPVGSARAIPIDVRVIAATHGELDQLAERGRFRSDLLARIDGYRIRLPSLSSRREDLGLLIGALLHREMKAGEPHLTPGAGVALMAHPWRLNVRELAHRLKGAVLLAGDGPISEAHLRLSATHRDVESAKNTPIDTRSPIAAEDEELKKQLLFSLQRHCGNVSEVAREMNRARMQIHRWMKRFSIDPSTFRDGEPPSEDDDEQAASAETRSK